MVARLDSAPASSAIPVRFRETARELLSETWLAARAIDNAWHTMCAEFESCRAELLSQSLRSQQEQLRFDQLRAELTAEHLQAAELAELRQQQALDREGVQAELRQLRLAVERPWSGMPVAHEHSPAVITPVLPAEFAPAIPTVPEQVTPVIEAAAAAVPAPREEPGLNSVLNHFQTLQKDLARRRALPKGTKPVG
jgi:hypothetical protein